jgi:hypothetical protein
MLPPIAHDALLAEREAAVDQQTEPRETQATQIAGVTTPTNAKLQPPSQTPHEFGGSPRCSIRDSVEVPWHARPPRSPRGRHDDPLEIDPLAATRRPRSTLGDLAPIVMIPTLPFAVGAP